MELLILAPFCLCGTVGLFICGFVALAFWLRSRPYSAQELANAEAAASDYLARATPALLPWTMAALADLACQWEGTRGGLLVGQHTGQVKSLGRPDQPGLLAYYLSLKGRNGFLRLRTSEREVRLDIAANDVRVTAWGQPLGSIILQDGALLDGAGQPLGRYHRYRGLRWQVGSALTSPRYGPVELHGRTVAEVNDTLIRSNQLFAADAARRPLLRNLASELAPEEEGWLLALVALELLYDALRRRRRASALRL
jgi:hypothetical protein